MDKSKAIALLSVKTGKVDIDGESFQINDLTIGQRGKIRAAIRKDDVRGQALIVCLGCETFDESDMDVVLASSGKKVSDLADAILDLSGLGDDKGKKD